MRELYSYADVHVWSGGYSPVPDGSIWYFLRHKQSRYNPNVAIDNEHSVIKRLQFAIFVGRSFNLFIWLLKYMYTHVCFL